LRLLNPASRFGGPAIQENTAFSLWWVEESSDCFRSFTLQLAREVKDHFCVPTQSMLHTSLFVGWHKLRWACEHSSNLFCSTKLYLLLS
jgi:hypothetical protein